MLLLKKNFFIYLLQSYYGKRSNKGKRQLHSKLLSYLFGSHVGQIIRELTRDQILKPVKKKKNYQKNVFAKKYQLTKYGMSLFIDELELRYYKNRYIAWFKKDIDEQIELLTNTLEKEKVFTKMQINALQTVKMIQDKMLRITEADYLKANQELIGKPRQNISKKIRRKIFKNEDVYYNLNHGITYYANDRDKGNRIYNVLTNCPKVIRKYIQIFYNNEWQYLVEIDHKNAQPYFLSLYLETIDGIAKHELKRFHRLTKYGLWRQFVIQETGLSIQAAKKKDMQYMFMSAHHKYFKTTCYEYITLFETHFPTIHAWMVSLEKKDTLLRHLESNWMNNLIFQVRQLQVPCFSVHDAIFVPSSSLPVCQELIFQSTSGKLGIRNYQEELC